MNLPPTSQLVRRLAREELATYRRATRLASRFELAVSGLILLELVCHTRDVLEDLGGFAEKVESESQITLRGLGRWAWMLASRLVEWAFDLWPADAHAVYAAIAAGTLRNVPMAAKLRLAALRAKDHELADWCAHWMAERVALAERLTSSLDADFAHARVGDAVLGLVIRPLDAHR